jgi:hypothetical protein
MSKEMTLQHIAVVQQLIGNVVTRLVVRAMVHDKSKLESPEVEIFEEFTPKLAGSTYGSEEYQGFLKAMKPGLDHHYAKNSHHPEFAYSKEEWRTIIGYEGLYEVSTMGRVKSVVPEKMLLLQPTKGYLQVQLSKDELQKSHMVHRLVAEAFLGNEDNKPEVNHIDGNYTNNIVTNLEWATLPEKQFHDEGIPQSMLRGMSLLDLIEMAMDWWAASMRHNDGNVFKSVEINQKRFGYSDELKQILMNTYVEMNAQRPADTN